MQVAMVTSWRVRCGIARYTEELAAALQQLPECKVSIVPCRRSGLVGTTTTARLVA